MWIISKAILANPPPKLDVKSSSLVWLTVINLCVISLNIQHVSSRCFIIILNCKKQNKKTLGAGNGRKFLGDIAECPILI